MELRASMASLPPHQAILAGFLIGLFGAAFGITTTMRRPRSAGVDGSGQTSANTGR
jgi:hypothetical protein